MIMNNTHMACVQGSTNGTNGIPISYKVLPIVPLVIPLVPMVMPMVPLVKLPMVPLGEPRTESCFAENRKDILVVAKQPKCVVQYLVTLQVFMSVYSWHLWTILTCI